MPERVLQLVPATNRAGLMDALFLIASALKTQVLTSPVLVSPDLDVLRDRLSTIAGDLHGLQQDVTITPTS